MKHPHTIRQIGIWLDHAEAHFIHPEHKAEEIETTNSSMESQVRHRGEGADGTLLGGYRASNNEHHKHQRKQNALHQYYKELQEKLMPYDEIYLFGPGLAKNELHNLLNEDKHFESKKIQVETADHLSENEMKVHVMKHFNVK